MDDTHTNGKDFGPEDERRESRHGSYAKDRRTSVKRVQNVALTSALEMQKPSLFTRRMFTVSVEPIQYITPTDFADTLPALCNLVHSNL